MKDEAHLIWHEVECGSYAADLSLWEQLADKAHGTILDLGCGCGRVALQLARRGHSVVGLDANSGFAAELGRVGAALSVEAVTGDARDFELDAEFTLVLAPMQLVQLFANRDQRAGCLRSVAGHLAPGGLAAFAIVESMPVPVDASPPLPDVREVDGWVYSSLPIETLAQDGEIRVRRLRQTVSPDGELTEEIDEVVLQALDADALEDGARQSGLRPAGRRPIPPTDAHVGSTVVLLQRAA